LIGVLAQLTFTFTGGLSTISSSQSNIAVTPAVTATATTAISAATPAPNSGLSPQCNCCDTLGIDVIGWLRLLVAFVLPLALLGFILKLVMIVRFSLLGMLARGGVDFGGEALSKGCFGWVVIKCKTASSRIT
jgi:hypothetical protein